ncbi:MAG: GAF domain-containing protein, partial [SAR324 cluster bacterium]|nr:GAF domain-containing protein [SAR324 cluster bacterium]
METSSWEKSHMLELFSQNTLYALALLDQDFNFVCVNEVYARACQQDPSEFPGFNFFDAYPHISRVVFEEVLSTKKPFQANASHFVFPGHSEWEVTYWDWTLIPVLDAAGRVELFLLMLDDVSERVKLEETLLDNQRFFFLFNDVALAVLQSTELEPMLQTLVDQLGKLFGADGCYAALWDEDQKCPIPAAAYGAMKETFLTTKSKPGEATLTREVLSVGHVISTEDSFNTPYLNPRLKAQLSFCSILSLPLIMDGQKLAAIHLVFKQPHHFSVDEITRGEQVTNYVALAVSKALLYKKESNEHILAKTLCDTVALLVETLDSNKVIERILANVGRVIAHDAANIMLIENDVISVTHSRGYPDAIRHSIETFQA